MDTHSPSHQQQLHRLRTVAGHLRHVEKMVEDGAYCIDILHQIQAIQAALSKVSTLILDEHLHHCVTKAVQGENAGERERVLQEILQLYQQKPIS